MNSPQRHRGLHSLAWLITEKLLQLGVSVITVGAVAQTLGVAAFGDFQYALAALFVFSSIALMAGSEVAAPTLAAQATESGRRTVLGSVFRARLAVSGLAFLAMALWALAQPNADLRLPLVLLAAALLVAEPFNTLRLIREVRQDTRVVAGIRLASSLFKLAAVLLGAAWGAGLTYFALVYAVEYLVTACLLHRQVREHGAFWTWPWSAPQLRGLLRQGVVVWIAIMAMMLAQRLDRLLLANVLDPSIYGQYTAAMTLVDSAWFFGPVAIAALAPSLVYRATAPIGTLVPRFAGVVLALGAAAAAALALLAPWIVPLIFGAAFAPASSMLAGSALVLLPGFAALALDPILIRAQRHRMVMAKWLLGVAVCYLALILNPADSWTRGPLAIGLGYSASLLAGAWAIWRLRGSRFAAHGPQA
ncbi:MAG: oligosaccharide flippase family protein [Pigmentiphaga sp.]|nr:oligosaccharide flippase family protein [Pigmentiphaga sp.]